MMSSNIDYDKAVYTIGFAKIAAEWCLTFILYFHKSISLLVMCVIDGMKYTQGKINITWK